MFELFAVNAEGVGKAVECLLDAGDGVHQRTRVGEVDWISGSNMGVPSRKKIRRGNCAGDQSGKKSGK
ncbi:hypothetical protein D3C72_1005420 [compost metagenome]